MSNHGAVNQQISFDREPVFHRRQPGDPTQQHGRGNTCRAATSTRCARIYDGYRYGEIPYGHFNR